MKTTFVKRFAFVLLLWPILAQAQTTGNCDQSPLVCLSEALALAEESGASEGNVVAVKAAQVGALARSGDFAAARAMLAQLEKSRNLIPAQLALAKALVLAGQADVAQEMISQALAANAHIQFPALQLDFFADIAGTQLLAGDNAGANESFAPVLAELEALPAGFTRDALIAKAVSSGMLFQDDVATLALIGGIESAYSRDEPILELARFLVREARPAQALEALNTLDNPTIRLRLLTELHIEFPALRREIGWEDALDSALKAALESGNQTSRTFALINRVKVYASYGEKESAARLLARAFAEAKKGLSRESYSGFLVALAEAYQLSGLHGQAMDMLEAAMRTVEGIEDENARSFALGEVIVGFARLGATGRAFEIVASLQDPDFQAVWLLSITETLGL